MAKIDIDEKLKLINEQKAAQQKKLDQLKEQEKTLKAQLRKKQLDLTREQETRLKILIGAWYLSNLEKGGHKEAVLEKIKHDLFEFARKAKGKAADLNVEVLESLLGLSEN